MSGLIWLWILAALIAALWLLGRLRLGVRVGFSPGAATADVTVGPLRIQVVPGRKQADKPPEKNEEKKKEPEKPPKKFPKPTVEDLKDAWRTLSPAFKKALYRTRRSIRIKPLELSVVLGGGQDPAAVAELYGLLNGVLWAGMPVLEGLLDIPDPRIHLGIDFDRGDTLAKGTAGVSIRLGTLAALGFGMAWPALGWLLRFRKRHQPVKQPAAQQAAETADRKAA